MEVAATRQSFGMQCRWLEPLPSVNSDPVFLVKAGVWADAVVMSHPEFEGLPNVCVVDRNHEIQVFTTSTADPTFANGIRLGGIARSLQNSQP